ncbi:MAG: hypothetical protein KDA66_16195 [Planctomycetaceae bacterium]|nr:hypothetical protein [Planctomycetaceae bacterium]
MKRIARYLTMLTLVAFTIVLAMSAGADKNEESDYTGSALVDLRVILRKPGYGLDVWQDLEEYFEKEHHIRVLEISKHPVPTFWAGGDRIVTIEEDGQFYLGRKGHDDRERLNAPLILVGQADGSVKIIPVDNEDQVAKVLWITGENLVEIDMKQQLMAWRELDRELVDTVEDKDSESK